MDYRLWDTTPLSANLTGKNLPPIPLVLSRALSLSEIMSLCIAKICLFGLAAGKHVENLEKESNNTWFLCFPSENISEMKRKSNLFSAGKNSFLFPSFRCMFLFILCLLAEKSKNFN